jgi:hypothetical protein
LRRMAMSVERYGDHHCPYTLETVTTGEMFKFDLPKTIPMIIQSHCLEEVAKTRPIGVNTSIDGAMITTNVSMVAAGLKVCDPQARCPFQNGYYWMMIHQGDCSREIIAFPFKL